MQKASALPGRLQEESTGVAAALHLRYMLIHLRCSAQFTHRPCSPGAPHVADHQGRCLAPCQRRADAQEPHQARGADLRRRCARDAARLCRQRRQEGAWCTLCCRRWRLVRGCAAPSRKRPHGSTARPALAPCAEDDGACRCLPCQLTPDCLELGQCFSPLQVLLPQVRQHMSCQHARRGCGEDARCTTLEKDSKLRL